VGTPPRQAARLSRSLVDECKQVSIELILVATVMPWRAPGYAINFACELREVIGKVTFRERLMHPWYACDRLWWQYAFESGFPVRGWCWTTRVAPTVQSLKGKQFAARRGSDLIDTTDRLQ
jgi:hypothetical protein